jgi:hypothetical protein
VPVGEEGSAEMVVTVPDAITEWKAAMFCTAPVGLGLAPATTLTVFKAKRNAAFLLLQCSK